MSFDLSLLLFPEPDSLELLLELDGGESFGFSPPSSPPPCLAYLYVVVNIFKAAVVFFIIMAIAAVFVVASTAPAVIVVLRALVLDLVQFCFGCR